MMKTLYSLVVLGTVSLSFSFGSCSGNGTDIEKEIEIDTTIEVTEGFKTDYETIVFQAEDGLDVYANIYEIDKSSPVIVLCHQARFNKFEYEGIAQRLNDMGFNCIAIDQRSGGPIANQQNETNNLARSQGVSVDYIDAIPDIKAAVDYASKRYDQDVILWGSSYSSSLVLWEALSNDKVKAAVAFSPGDYYDELGSLTDKLPELEKPFFITAMRGEFGEPGQGGVADLVAKTQLGENQIVFKPEGNGHHGSRALWVNQEGGEEYWEAITPFLNALK